MLEKLVSEAPIKANPRGIPSLWYMPLIGGTFFDGFGFKQYKERFGWATIPMDEHEERHPPKNPLLPYVEKLAQNLPKRWDHKLKQYVTNDDWLLWELEQTGAKAKE